MLAWACAGGAAATCPDAEQRAALQAQAGHAIAAGASVDVAWGQVREAVAPCADPSIQARLLADWAGAQRRHGTSLGVRAIELERLALAERHGLLRQEAEARVNVAMIDMARGDLDGAAVQMDLALERVRRLGDVEGQARVLSELSRLERRRGDYLAALRHELTGLDLRRQLDPAPEIWRSLLSLAVLYEQIELFDRARDYYVQALDQAERDGIGRNIASALTSYAGFLNDFGAEPAPQALAMATRALELNRGLGDDVRIGSSLLQVGRAHLALGRFDAAEAAFAEVLAITRDGGYEALRAHVEFRWGELLFERGELGEAHRRIEWARAEYERQGNRHRLVKVHGTLERLHAALGDELAAARAGREHFRLRNELLGANASGKLGELMTNFALADAENRNQRLAQENALNALRLEHERRLRYAGYLIAGIIVAGLVLLMLRHAATRRLNRMLSEQKREIESQRAALAEANAQLIGLSRTDALTGLASRAYGLERLSSVLTHARERGTAPALVLFDLDHFKEINDRHGHPAGDQVLASVAATMRELAPEDALVARVGGEELMLVLENAECGRAELLADAIRRRVRDLAIDVGPRRVQVTLSAGIAHVSPSATESLRELYAAADQALYAAKHAGRDCVRTHGVA